MANICAAMAPVSAYRLRSTVPILVPRMLIATSILERCNLSRLCHAGTNAFAHLPDTPRSAEYPVVRVYHREPQQHWIRRRAGKTYAVPHAARASQPQVFAPNS